MGSDYRPRPIHTAHIKLDYELIELVELLAENAHDIWAQQRLNDGWAYGPERCDKSLFHPCLVPYTELPDSEKAYDRNAVLGTVRAILALGFVVEKRGPDSATQQDAPTDAAVRSG